LNEWRILSYNGSTKAALVLLASSPTDDTYYDNLDSGAAAAGTGVEEFE
jgi:hypothetical protein